MNATANLATFWLEITCCNPCLNKRAIKRPFRVVSFDETFVLWVEPRKL